MSRTAVQTCRVIVILALAGLLVACGSTSMTTLTSTTPTGAVAVSISPATAALASGLSQSTQFTATVSGSSNTAVSWSVNGVAGGNNTVGTISSGGVYSPPSTLPATASSQMVSVTATSAADTTKSASADVILVNAGTVTPTANPQVAQYSFTAPTGADVYIQFGPDTTYGLQTWSQPVPGGGGTLKMLVAGMRAYTTYHMRAVVSFTNGAQYEDPDQVFTTGGLPASRMPNLSVVVPPGPATSPGVEMLNLVNFLNPPSFNPLQCVVSDLAGNVIWYYDITAIPNAQADTCFPMKLLPNGNVKIVIGNNNPSPPVSEVQEIDLAGDVLYQLTTPQLNTMLAQAGSPIVSAGFHHDFVALPNGHTVYIVMDQRNVTLTGETTPTLVTGDALVDIDQNGNLAWTWSTFDHLDVNYHPFVFPDWIHANALTYSPADGDLMLNSRSLSWLMKIDYENGAGSGNILWKLGPNGDFTLTNGGPSDWFYNEHNPNIVMTNPLATPSADNFELSIWDNGNQRPDPVTGLPCENSAGGPGGGSCYSRGVLVDVDVPSKTATLVWTDDLSPIFALCCGNIGVFPNQNVELGTGGQQLFPTQASEVMEVTQQPSPQVLWQMNVSGQFSYRMIRIPSLYPGVSWAP